jgi:FixJ family two-component response regulator
MFCVVGDRRCRNSSIARLRTSLGCLALKVRLPERSGLDFQEELAKVDLRLPIIFISGHADVPMSVRAMKAGAVEFRIKPVRDRDLLDAIQQAIAEDRVRHDERTVVTPPHLTQ